MAVYHNSPGVVLTREQTAQLAYQAGARGDDLVFLTGIPQGESSYMPGVHRTDSPRSRISGDRGLWQINYIWDNQLKQAGIINSPSDLFDPMTNARAAVYVLQHQGRQAWFAYDGSMGGNDRINWSAARQAVTNATNSGLISQNWNNTNTPSAAPSTNASGGGGVQQVQDIPSDARLVSSAGKLFAFFDTGNGNFIRYDINPGQVSTAGRRIENVAPGPGLTKVFGRYVLGGNIDELEAIPTGFGTFKAFWNSIVDTIIGPSNPARRDPEVLRVLAEYAARPDMERAELENKLQATKWFQARTQAELEWNDLSEAERGKRRREVMAQMQQLYQRYMGKAPDTDFMAKHADLDRIASGKITLTDWVESVLKPAAEGTAESPWARELRDEKEAQRQRGFDIGNTTSRIRDELERYGLKWTGAQVTTWARAIVEKRKNDADLTAALEAGAQALYPGLGPLNGSDVVTLAAPWLETYERVLEKKGSLFTPQIREALAKGEPVWDMEKRLTKSSAWLTTRNADERMNDLASQIGEMFGYN
jgi:hypothetical protein